MNRGHELCIAVPASLVSDVPHLREKTLKIGFIGRAAAIFRVSEIIIFPDLRNVDQSREGNLISVILSYMETPQYLRKRLFTIRPELRYAGVLPPLRTPHHPLANEVEDLSVGEYREGAVVSLTRGGSLVDIGVKRPVLIPRVQLQANRRVTVKVTGLGKRPTATLTDQNETEEYWGYRVTFSEAPFGRMVKTRSFELVIATSRSGAPFLTVKDELAEIWKRSSSVLVAFGGPSEGLYEIVTRESLELSDVADFVVNMIPGQGTETVRTEEAVYACLASLNLFR